jgi:hypothetical protein
MKPSVIASLLLTLDLLLVPVISCAEHQQFTPCCKDGSSPFASESPNTTKSNKDARFIGSEIPPSSGHNPDHIDKYENPALNNLYQTPPPAPSASASENPPMSSEIQSQRYSGDASRNLATPAGT